MPLVIGVHYALAFGLELGLLFAFGLCGYHLGQGGFMGALLAAALVAAAILLWARFAAPSSVTRLAEGPLIVFKFVLFGLGALAFWLAGWPEMAIGFGVLAALDLCAAVLLHRV